MSFRPSCFRCVKCGRRGSRGSRDAFQRFFPFKDQRPLAAFYFFSSTFNEKYPRIPAVELKHRLTTTSYDRGIASLHPAPIPQSPPSPSTSRTALLYLSSIDSVRGVVADPHRWRSAGAHFLQNFRFNVGPDYMIFTSAKNCRPLCQKIRKSVPMPFTYGSLGSALYEMRLVSRNLDRPCKNLWDALRAKRL